MVRRLIGALVIAVVLATAVQKVEAFVYDPCNDWIWQFFCD